jgi:hypothetical protein
VTPSPLEPYVTAAELAGLMRVSLSTVRRWTAAGMPSETWGMARTRRYLASECLAWARARTATVSDTARHLTAAEGKD